MMNIIFSELMCGPPMRGELPQNVLVILSVASSAVNHGWYMYDGMEEYRS